MERQSCVLVIERKNELSSLLAERTKEDGVELVWAKQVGDVLKITRSTVIDLVVVHKALTENEALELLSALDSNGNGEKIVLVVSDGNEQELKRHAIGFGIKVVTARDSVESVCNLVRGFGKNKEGKARNPQRIYRFGDVVVNRETWTVIKRGEQVYLREKEMKLLLFLMENAGKVFTREELKEKVWGDGCPSDPKTVDVTISSLRKKIEDEGQRGRHLATLRKKGYTFRF